MSSAPTPTTQNAGSTSFAIALRIDQDSARPSLVGTADGRPISDQELRTRSPVLGRAVTLLRRMHDIMERTQDAPARRGALLAEMAEWLWTDEMSDVVRQETSRTVRHRSSSVGPPRDADQKVEVVWAIPE